jgi:hypothetical protein
MDHVLSWPDPDWDNPQPYDGPTNEDTVMFGDLKATADGIRAWVTGAYLKGTTDEAWTELGARIIAAGQRCIDHGRTVKGEVEKS